MEDRETRMDDAKVEFNEFVSTALNEFLDAVNVSGVLFDSWILGQEK